jgi:hypothetical protein
MHTDRHGVFQGGFRFAMKAMLETGFHFCVIPTVLRWATLKRAAEAALGFSSSATPRTRNNRDTLRFFSDAIIPPQENP